MRPANAITILMAIAACIAACSSKEERPTPPGMDLTSMQMAPAAAGSCEIDAVKMCQTEGGAPPSQPAPASSYGASNMPESIEFQIPAGQAIKLMCYYDPQHTSVYRADATALTPLTGNSVEYMEKQGFCISK